MLDMERIDGLIGHARDVQTALRVNAAMADPKRLQEEQRDVVARLRMAPAAPSFTKADAVALAERVLAEIEGKPEVPVHGP